jgi:hypothetical protein
MPASAQTVTVPYPGSQVAGDFNVVIVGWDGGVSVANGLTDSTGNVYSLAVGPTVSGRSQSIYYAPNIKAGTNSVTVNFTGNAATRIFGFSNIAESPPPIRWMW